MNKPLILFLPGMLCDARLWQHQVAALTGLAQVSVADLSHADSIAELAEQVLAKAPGQRFALVGFSLGGCVALEIMRQAPGRICALALLDTTAHADSEESQQERLRLIDEADQDFAGVIRALLPKLLHRKHLQNAALLQLITTMAERMGPEVFIRQQRAMLGRIDSRASLGQIQCPTLLLCGLDDVVTPPALHVEMQAAIAGAQLAQLKLAGHLTPLEQPQRVSSNLKHWLVGLRRPLPRAIEA